MKRLIKRVLLSKVIGFSHSLFNSFKSRVLDGSGVVEAESCAVTTLSNLDSKNLLQSATFVLAPSGYKSGVIYSQVPSNGNGDLTVTRATSATRVNSSGVIETVASGVPQLDYSLGGCPNFLFEPQRTNYMLYSEQFDNAVWTANNVTIIANQAISPYGTLTADKMTATGTSVAFCEIRQDFAVTSGTTYTFSIFAKYNSQRYVQIVGSLAGFGSFYWNIDLTNGIETAYSAGTSTVLGRKIENYSNGWYRISITLTAIASGSYRSSLNCIQSATSVRGEQWTPNGTDNLYIYGEQYEQGAYPTSYIPTTSAAVTRNATSFTRSNIFTNGLISSSGGTWLVEVKNNLSILRDLGSTGFTLAGTGNNELIIYYAFISGRLVVTKNLAGSYTDLLNTSTVTSPLNLKIVLKWDGTNLDLFVNGQKIFLNAVQRLFSFTNLNTLIGNGAAGRLNLAQMVFWDTPLLDAQCIALTS